MPRTVVRCRDIAEADVEDVIDLLTAGFRRQRDRAFWTNALSRLRQRSVPTGYSRYGCLMECEGRVVGVILQIFAPIDGSERVRCNFSSWWVMPAYRAFGALLVSRAFRHKVTYTNITPAPHSLPILEAQGYRRYCSGRVIAMPMFASRGGDAVVRAFDETRDAAGHLDPTEYQILKDHASYGCICLVCEKGGKTVPFVFAPRKRMLALRFAVLVYGSAAGEFLDFAQALGRYLARQKLPFVVIDANGPMPGACGIYFSRKPKFFRGPDRPRLNDHAYTERALFGS